uniref:Putative ovule protein n=1 Tax=Solanum chacoense TaxID=4108 RepID=A0A0V0IQM3_SOLCH
MMLLYLGFRHLFMSQLQCDNRFCEDVSMVVLNSYFDIKHSFDLYIRILSEGTMTTTTNRNQQPFFCQTRHYKGLISPNVFLLPNVEMMRFVTLVLSSIGLQQWRCFYLD